MPGLQAEVKAKCGCGDVRRVCGRFQKRESGGVFDGEAVGRVEPIGQAGRVFVRLQLDAGQEVPGGLASNTPTALPSTNSM